MEEKVAKAVETQLQDTTDIKPTEMLYLSNPDLHTFQANIISTLHNLTKPEPYPRDIVILDKTGL